ncbi:MAG: alpha-L-fucosidase, partial [Ginsengibacter sp.]
LMQEAGMEYITFTTKHHDGFCMWDTKQTDYNIMHTPYKKDILGMLSDECHKRKIPLCLYYSIVDWHHPNYPNEGGDHELFKPEPGDQPDWNTYKEFLKAQVRELCSNYGTIHGFWWDMNSRKEHDPSVNATIRKLQPDAVINNRGFDEGDFGTPEREEDEGALENKKFTKPTEACQSVDSLSWGYKKDAEYYSDRYLIRSIDKFLSANANYLLNVGPTAEGIIPEVSANILRRIGKFIKPARESLYSIEPMPMLIKNSDASYTASGKNLYIHFNKDCSANGFSLQPLNSLPVKATLLNDSRPIKFVVKKSPHDYDDKNGNLKAYLRLENLPVNELTNTVMVVKLEFDREISSL